MTQKPEFEASDKVIAEIEKRAIEEALIRNDWRRLATASELGIDKTTLWRKMKRYGLQAPDTQA